MTKYNVTMRRTLVQYVTITVDADSDDNACHKGFKHAMSGNAEWIKDETTNIECDSIEPC